MNNATVIGAGLAGVEAAYALSRNGIKVRLIEMKPKKFSPAHTYPGFAELVCSNSFKSDWFGNAAEVGHTGNVTASGLLKAEMRLLGSLTLEVAEITKVPAGGALAVDRTAFSDEITRRLKSDPNIEVVEQENILFPQSDTIIATGPLTSDAFAAVIKEKLQEREKGSRLLNFYDAAAPIVTAESIDMSKVFVSSRYSADTDIDGDYINCPFTKEEYDIFYDALINAETAPLHDIDIGYYEGCMPVEVLAKRGYDSLRFGCMKPVGLTVPQTGKRPYANLQLRKENAGGTMYNLVGFQTNLKFGEQSRVFSLIPGLENAEFVRYGVMHKNTFIDSPRLLDNNFMLRGSERVYFAGQITGVEGYMESAASGIVAGLSLAGIINALPRTCITGALANYISDKTVSNFQPMGANMGLLPPPDGERIKSKQERNRKLAETALTDLKAVL